MVAADSATAPAIHAVQLKQLIDDAGELAIVDVREAGQYPAGHLFFATHVPYSRLELEVEAFVPRKAVPVVVYDAGDASLGVAARAAVALTRMGYADVRVLDGGAPAWAAAGYTLYEGVNLPTKTFGELVEHELDTPRISAETLAGMQAEGGDFIILDGRTPEEYRRFNIPGGISCPNAELPLRIDDLVPTPATTVVINCAGRTRSIIGAQTLINFGIANPVVALENGTQGWALADLKLEHDARRFSPGVVTEEALRRARARAEDLAGRFGVAFIDRETLAAWQDDTSRTLYCLDVRGRDEFDAGHLPGSRHAPGGQLVQATDRWVGVRGARIVVCDDTEVRAICTAHWLLQMGWDVHVLKGGIGSDGLVRSDAEPAPTPAAAALPEVSVAEVRAELAGGDAAVLDIRSSTAYRDGHVPGARWAIRPFLARVLAEGAGRVILVAEDLEAAGLGAEDARAAGAASVAVMAGGFDAWTAGDNPVERSPDVPSEPNCIDVETFTSGRHLGNKDHMRQYLTWETGLVDQLDDQERSAFSIQAP